MKAPEMATAIIAFTIVLTAFNVGVVVMPNTVSVVPETRRYPCTRA
ncbi:MAG: hypothetical protein L0Z50_29840 [Verrucomicrobiales bacterium]|nr:hypothetical protein [Verrucomicrobiales bacterium]